MPRLARSADHEKLYRLTPAGAMRLLSSGDYWRFDFLRLFLDRIDVVRMDDPETAQAFALVAPELVRRIPLDAERGGFGSPRVREIWWIYALAVQASALRAAGRGDEAAMVFEMAFRNLGELDDPPPWLRGQLLLRRGIFRSYRGERSGRDDIAKALEICESACDEHPAARQGYVDALLARGCFGWMRAEEGVTADFALAMNRADRKTSRGRLAFDCGFYNLLTVTTEETTAREQAGALELLIELRRTMARSSRRRRLLVRWAEGRILTNLGLYRPARKALEYVHLHLSATVPDSVRVVLILDLVLVYCLMKDKGSYQDFLVDGGWRAIEASGACPKLAGVFDPQELPSEASIQRLRLYARQFAAGIRNAS